MHIVRSPRTSGVCFLAIGIAFVAVSTVQGLAPFLGVGLAFTGLGIGAVLRSRRTR